MNQASLYNKDRQWSDTYLDQVKEIIKFVAIDLLEVRVAPEIKDIKNATDFILTITGGDIAVRLRRSKYSYRDLTIRAKRDTGSETELSKIRKGAGRWYLYGWLNENNKIYNWIFVDLNKLRESGLLDVDESHFIPNGDGTYFIAVPKDKLASANCLIDYVL